MRGRVAGLLNSGAGQAVALSVPALLFVVVLGLWPLADFLLGSVRSPGGLTLVHYRQLLADDLFVNVATRTIAVAAGVAVITLGLSYPLAYALSRVAGAAKTMLIALVILPYLTSVLVRVYAWAALLALEGPVNRALVALGLFDTPQLLGHSLFGTVLGMVHILCPIAVLTLWSQIEKIDPMQRIVAASLGASRPRAFLTVFLPQSLPGIVAAGSLVFVLALGAYVIPAALGGTKGLLFAQLLVDQATQLLNWEIAGAMGVLMLLLTALPIVLWQVLQAIRQRLGSGGTALTPIQHIAARYIHPPLDRIPDGAFRLAWRLTAAAVTAFLVVPELVVLAFSFGPEKQVVLPPPSLSLAGYRSVLSDPDWLAPAQRSLAYALGDAVIATVLGALAAYGFVRGPTRWARFGSLVLLTPLVLPEIVTAISFFVFATKAQLAGTDLGIILGQAVGTIGLVVIVVGAVIRGVDVSIEHAAQACGASRLRVLRDIVAPLAGSGILVGFVYGFLHAFDNVVTPLFIAGQRSTITVRMFLSMQEQLTSAPAVIASLIILLLVACLGCALLLPAFTALRSPLIKTTLPKALETA